MLERPRPRFRRRVARCLAGAGAALAGVAFAGDRIGFGWVSGPAAIGAIASWLLAFALSADSPATTTEGDVGSHVPNISGNTDGE